MAKNEMRQDPVTRNWVIYAPGRGKRPSDFAKRRPSAAPVPAYEPSCPFCPGNEDLLTPILMERRVNDRWAVRVVSNKFPALTPDTRGIRFSDGFYRSMEGYGCHEVVIETPLHDRQPSAMSQWEVEQVVEAYLHRFRHIRTLPGISAVIIFRNHGVAAGTSLVHPHSQIIATGLMPQHVRHRDDAARQHFDDWGRCLFCDILDRERSDGRRILSENDRFLCFVPFAAEVPFELWIMPKSHQSSFGNMAEPDAADFASILQESLFTLQTACGDPEYNYMINTGYGEATENPYLHWHLVLKPRMVTRAGFEMGSGIQINPTLPEDNIRILKGER